MNRTPLSLPLVAESAAPAAPDWHGWAPAFPLADALTGAAAAPEPDAPQGEYGGDGGPALDVSLSTPRAAASHPVELLAPAGGPDAAFAAFEHGADAGYLAL